MYKRQIKDHKPTVFTPKALKWDEITIPDEIELQEPQITTQIERRDIEQIIEEPDGKVVQKFRSLSVREDSSIPSSSNYRRSFSDFSSQTGNLDHTQRYRFRSPSKICKDLQNKFVVDDLKCQLVESKIQFVREKESMKTKENSYALL